MARTGPRARSGTAYESEGREKGARERGGGETHLLGHRGDRVSEALGIGARQRHQRLLHPRGVRNASLGHLAVTQHGGRRGDGGAQVLEARDVVVREARGDGVADALQRAELLHRALRVRLVGVGGGGAKAAAVLHDLHDLRDGALAHALDARGQRSVLRRLDLHPPRLELADGLRANGSERHTTALTHFRGSPQRRQGARGAAAAGLLTLASPRILKMSAPSRLKPARMASSSCDAQEQAHTTHNTSPPRQ